MWLLFVLLAPKYPEVTNNTSTSELKRKVASFSSFICNEHLCNKIGLFFCFCLFWFDLFCVFLLGAGGSFVYSYVGSLVFSYPLITDTCMWIQSFWNLKKTPRCHVATQRIRKPTKCRLLTIKYKISKQLSTVDLGFLKFSYFSLHILQLNMNFFCCVTFWE